MQYSHFEGLIPDRIKRFLDRFGLLLVGVSSVRGQFDLDVGVAQTVGVHGDEIASLDN